MASSTLTMAPALVGFMEFTGVSLTVSLNDALRAASANPARLLQRSKMCEELDERKLASLTVFRLVNGAMEIEATVVGGETVYSRGQARPHPGRPSSSEGNGSWLVASRVFL